MTLIEFRQISLFHSSLVACMKQDDGVDAYLLECDAGMDLVDGASKLVLDPLDLFSRVVSFQIGNK